MICSKLGKNSNPQPILTHFLRVLRGSAWFSLSLSLFSGGGGGGGMHLALFFSLLISVVVVLWLLWVPPQALSRCDARLLCVLHMDDHYPRCPSPSRGRRRPFAAILFFQPLILCLKPETHALTPPSRGRDCFGANLRLLQGHGPRRRRRRILILAEIPPRTLSGAPRFKSLVHAPYSDYHQGCTERHDCEEQRHSHVEPGRIKSEIAVGTLFSFGCIGRIAAFVRLHSHVWIDRVPLAFPLAAYPGRSALMCLFLWLYGYI
mmetsp:Transcript_27955/g.54482  ORF Transcript_27955/g.54482 Transcript_27955/m.54482 type:complete len:262 (-) Transcript_27955:42-827(-)